MNQDQVVTGTEKNGSRVVGKLFTQVAADATATPPAPANPKGARKMLNIKIVSWSLGIFTATSFVLCVIYGLIVPPGLHMAPFLEMVLPAFKWLTFWGQRGVTFSDKWRVFFNIIWRRTCVLGNRLSCHTSRSSKVRNSPQRVHWPDINS